MLGIKRGIDNFDIISAQEFTEIVTNGSVGIEFITPFARPFQVHVANRGYIQSEFLVSPKMVFSDAASADQTELGSIVPRHAREVLQIRCGDVSGPDLLAQAILGLLSRHGYREEMWSADFQ